MSINGRKPSIEICQFFMQNLKILFDTISRTHFLQEDLGKTTEDKQRNENLNMYIDMSAILPITFLKVFLII